MGSGLTSRYACIDVNDANEPYYYHFDGLGSIAALSDVR